MAKKVSTPKSSAKNHSTEEKLPESLPSAGGKPIDVRTEQGMMRCVQTAIFELLGKKLPKKLTGRQNPTVTHILPSLVLDDDLELEHLDIVEIVMDVQQAWAQALEGGEKPDGRQLEDEVSCNWTVKQFADFLFRKLDYDPRRMSDPS